MKYNKLKYEEMAKIIKAMSHPTRLFIVDSLKDKEYCVSYFIEKVKADASTISKHLKVLKDVGIIADNKRGNQVFYSLRCPCILSFYSCVRNVIQKDIEERSHLFDKI